MLWNEREVLQVMHNRGTAEKKRGRRLKGIVGVMVIRGRNILQGGWRAEGS